MEKEITIYAKLSILLFLYFLVVFFFQGITSVPTEGDSLAYHLPIARDIITGVVFNPSRTGYALGFYPGTGELILSLFMLGHIPLNLYNLLGWVILTFLMFRLALAYKLSPTLAIIYAVSAGSVLAIIRLVTNQTIDIWLAVFFTWSLLLLNKPQKSLSYFLLLGTALGLLVGSKFSGPFYMGVLLLFMGRQLLAFVTLKRMGIFLVPFLIFGASWYIRNSILTGNPLYPQQHLFLPGNSTFHLMEWTGWKTVLFYPNGLILMFEAFFSEFMLWSLTPLVTIVYLIKNRKSTTKQANIQILIFVGLLNFLIFFFLPSTGNNIITYLRYLLPAFIPLILATFLIAREVKKLSLLLPLALVNALLLISYTSHRPKLFLIYLIFAGIVMYKYDILVKRLSKT